MKIRGFIKRSICIDVKSEEEMIEVLERLSERLGYINFKAETRPGQIRIVFYGPKDIIRNAMTEAYEIANTVKGILYPDAKGLFSYSIKEIVSIIRGVAIPLNLLVYSLRFKGYEAHLEGGYVKTDARLEDVRDIASIISDAYEEMKFMKMTPMCKRLVALYTSIRDTSIYDAIADLEEANLIKKIGEDSYTLALEFNQALSKLEILLREEEDS